MRLGILGIVSALGGVAAGAVVWEGGPDTVVFPPQDIPIHFTHDYHTRKSVEVVDANGEVQKIEGEGLSCDFCHDTVASSTAATDRNIPGHGSCDTCHEEWIEGEGGKVEPVEQCKHCHLDPNVVTSQLAASKLSIPDPNIIFPHKRHVDAGVECISCHNDVPKKTVATRDDYPTMDRCIACHNKKGVSTECRTCHLTLPSGRMITEFKEGELSPRRFHSFAIHDADFMRDHSVPAKRDKAYCNNCHGEDFCLQCHDGVARGVRYHPGDWLAQHHVRAKQDDFRCQSCHRLQSFCIDCHVRSGVASVSQTAFVAKLQTQNDRRTIRRNGDLPVGPHPMAADGWISPTSRNFHGFFAQRNIRTCASCHQEQFCITCHASQAVVQKFGLSGIGANPHGKNPQRLKGSAVQKHAARMCLKCHSPSDPDWR